MTADHRPPEFLTREEVDARFVTADRKCPNAGRWNDCHGTGRYWYNEDTPMAGSITPHWVNCDAGCPRVTADRKPTIGDALRNRHLYQHEGVTVLAALNGPDLDTPFDPETNRLVVLRPGQHVVEWRPPRQREAYISTTGDINVALIRTTDLLGYVPHDSTGWTVVVFNPGA